MQEKLIYKFLVKINKNSVFLLLLDVTIVAVASIMAVLIKFDFRNPIEFPLITFWNILCLVWIKIIWFRIFSLYHGMYRYTSIWDLIKMLKANFFSSITIYFIVYLSLIIDIYLLISLVTIDFILCSTLISSSRLGIRIYFSHYKSFERFKNISFSNKKNVLIIGAGYCGQNIVRQILSDIKSNINVAGHRAR